MDTMPQNYGLPCEAAQDLLIHSEAAPLTASEIVALSAHLQHCERCLAFQSTMINIHHFIQTTAQDHLAPNPATPLYLRNKIQPRRQVVTSGNRFWHTLREILNFRIPAYQAVLGMAAAVAMMIAIDKLDAANNGTSSAQTVASPKEKPMLVAPATVNHIAKIDSQTIGRTVADDSLLMKFMVTVGGENI